jgi:rhodanese-related sulfurtransferase
MTPNELNARTHHVRIVDVREPREYCADLGHIAGSLLVPLAELESAARRWPRDDELVRV